MQQHEQLSALMDGDLASIAHDFIEQLESTPELRRAWTRYHLIGNALRAAEPAPAVGELATRVRVALAVEPAILARRPAQPPAASRRRPFAAVAMAVSVAALAVLALRGTGEPGATAPQVASTAAPPVDATARETAATLTWEAAPVANTTLQDAHRQMDRRLNAYLVNFNEQRSRLGMPGVHPYVRIVGFEAQPGR